MAYEIFADIKDNRKEYIDVIMFESAVRAAGHCRPWHEVISLLKESHNVFGSDAIEIINSAITTLKYNKYPESCLKYCQRSVLVSRAFDLVQYSLDLGMSPSSLTMVRFLHRPSPPQLKLYIYVECGISSYL